MTNKQFLKTIKSKFRSLQRFLDLTGTKRSEVDKAINDKNKDGKLKAFKELLKKADKIESTEIPSLDVTEPLINEIRRAIYTQHHNQSEFCKKHKFTAQWLSALLNGKCQRRSRKVKRLLTTLNIK